MKFECVHLKPISACLICGPHRCHHGAVKSQCNICTMTEVPEAVAAERERCAQIVENNSYSLVECKEQPWAADLNMKFRYAAMITAKLIRGGK